MKHIIAWPVSAARRDASLNRFDEVDAARTALIVVDMQRAFLEPGHVAYCPYAPGILPNVNRLARALRAAGGIVAHTRHTVLDDPERGQPRWHIERASRDAAFAAYLDSLRPASPGHALHPGLEVEPDDLVIDKVRYSAFLAGSSPLDAELRARGVDTVIVTGTVTNVCCESSARDAHMLGYKLFFIADANAANSDAEHNAALDILGLIFADVRTTDEMLALIAAA
jgi:ureidoacrylate peracid hydrolase